MNPGDLITFKTIDENGKIRLHTIEWHINIDEEIRMLETLNIHFDKMIQIL